MTRKRSSQSRAHSKPWKVPPPNFAAIPPTEIPKLLVADPAFIAPFWPADAGAEFLSARGREAASAGKILAQGAAGDNKLRRLLPSLRVPTLILWGGKDRILLPGLAQHWARAIPGSSAEVIDEAGHLLLDESPRARKLAGDFLARA